MRQDTRGREPEDQIELLVGLGLGQHGSQAVGEGEGPVQRRCALDELHRACLDDRD